MLRMAFETGQGGGYLLHLHRECGIAAIAH